MTTCGLLAVLGGLSFATRVASPSLNHQVRPATLRALLDSPGAALSNLDLARMNLLCAEGLIGNESMAIDGLLALLDAWAARVKSETDLHRYRFVRNPAEFERSEGFFKMLLLGVVFAEDYGVHYKRELRTDPGSATMNDGFFADPRPVFLTGLLGERRAGTCSSMPVLYVAVGRRLGYPLKLVTTKGHLFVRWDGAGERFNLEVTGQGLSRFPDDYYRRWPYSVSEAEVKAERYLESLSPAEELAVFLSIRGMCLRELRRMQEAGEAFGAAARLAPGVASYRVMENQCRALRGPAVKLAQNSGGR
jgi:hypothetical protein